MASTTVLLETQQQLVVPLRATLKRPLPTYSPVDQENKLARLSQLCTPSDAKVEVDAPFVLMRMCSTHATHGPNAFRNKHYTDWQPFTTVPTEIRAIFDSLETIEAEEHALGIHSCRCHSGVAALYEVEAAIALPQGED